jgi:hypothetical protein
MLTTIGVVSIFEIAADIATCVGVVISVVLFALFWLQLRELRRQVKGSEEAVKMDHDRRKMQATIDFYAATIEKRTALSTKLPSDRDSEGTARFVKKYLRSDGQHARDLTDYLGFFELLATGVNTDTLDFKVMERMAGPRIEAIATNYSSWIAYKQKSLNSPKLFCELVDLASEFKVHRDERNARERANGLQGPTEPPRR